MKKILTAVAALSLCGCAAIPTAISAYSSLSNVISTNGQTVTLEGKRALILAHNAYQAAAGLAEAAVRSGQLNKAQLDVIETANNDAFAILNEVSDDITAAERAAALFVAADKINHALEGSIVDGKYTRPGEAGPSTHH